MAGEFEEAVRLAGGWADLALPSAEDAARYFASFRHAPPDNSALVPGPQVRGQPYPQTLTLAMRNLCRSACECHSELPMRHSTSHDLLHLLCDCISFCISRSRYSYLQVDC